MKQSEYQFSKEYIHQLKEKKEKSLAVLVKENYTNSSNIILILKNIGDIAPASTNESWMIELLTHPNDEVRYWTVKLLGKLKTEQSQAELYKIAIADTCTMVKREAVSSIGRMRLSKNIPFLKNMLDNKDPKIICQAIRGLLVFKGNSDIDNTLKRLVKHPNEMVRSVINKEYFLQKDNKDTILPHTETYPYLRNVVVNADVREVLRLVPSESVHLTFTSPPYYNARDYSIYPSYDDYLFFLEKVFLDVYRVTKEGRFLIVNTSPVIVPRVSRAHSSKRYPIPFDLHYYLVKMGWEFIDDIVWEKPEYSVKNRIGGFQQHRKPLAYKPNTVTEYLMVYRKKTARLIDWNIRQYNLDTVNASKVEDGFETTNVWKICPKSDKVHSAVFPYELCKRVIEYYSFKGDLVFDPFGGSGTVGRTAKNLGRYFFLTEKEPKYFEYMKTLQPKDNLFEKEATSFLSLEQFKNTVL